MKKLLLCFLAVPLGSAWAAALAPQSVLCESPEHLVVIAKQPWVNDPGPEQMRKASATLEFYKLQIQSAALFKNLAAQEESIRADSRGRLAQGQTTARATAAQGDQVTAEANVKVFEAVVAGCALSDAASAPAVILEKKPISGVSRIKTKFRGAEADLWVRSTSVSE